MQASLAQFTFGPEFEVLLPQHFTQSGAARELSRLIGEPVHPRSADCPAGQWKVVTDGSVRGPGAVGLEFVGPILQGQTGIDRMVKVVDALRTMGATVNASCGFHVHVGGHDQSVGFFKNLVKLYAKFEDALDAIMPSTRRGNGCSRYRYCRSVKLGAGRIDSATSVFEIGRALQRASNADAPKYHKVNVMPHGKPTVEFRHHAGTVDSAKAKNWVMTCLRLVLAAKEGKTGETGATAVQTIAWDLARLSGKQFHVATLVARPEGATNAEIRTAFGYATISAQKQLKDARLGYRTVRDRATGKDRFFAVLPTETVQTETADAAFPSTLEGLADLLGSETAERAFFARRSARAAA
jgi:hypothetical protein